MTGFFRELARGLFSLRSGWKTLRDRRLQLPAVLTALFVLNYITVASGISVAYSLNNDVSAFDPIANPILLLLMIISWLYMRFRVVTDDFVDQIARDNTHEANVQRARNRFLVYLTVSIVSFLAVLVWVALVGPI